MRWKSALPHAVLASLVAAIPAAAQDTALVARLDRAYLAAVKTHRVPGATIAIVRDGTPLLLRGFGMAVLEDSQPADPERSLYRLASVAKLFIADAVVGLVEAGRLDLDAPVTRYAPGIPLPPSPAITLRHLLTHRGGFEERMIGYAAPDRASLKPLGEFLAASLPARSTPPGEWISYSNHGMALAAFAAEAAAGEPFHALAARTVFAPREMTRTWYIAPPDSLRADIAPGYRCGADDCERAPPVWSHAYPVGLAYSTARDMSRFMLSMLATPDRLGAQQATHDPWLPGIGFAFLEHAYRGHRVISHAGGVPGASTSLVLVPEARIGVFVATNAGEPGFTAAMVHAALDGLIDDRRTPPVATGAVREYAGSYRMPRIATRTIERFGGAFAFTVNAWARGDTLLLSAGLEPRRFVRVDSLRLAEVGGDARLVVRRGADGMVSHLLTSVPTAGSEVPVSLARVPWYEVPYFLNEYASWVTAAPLLALALWGLIAAVRWLMRRRRAVGVPAAGPRGAIALGVVATALSVAFTFGFIARSTRDLGRGQGIALGMDAGAMAWLGVPWLIAAGALVLCVLGVLAWRRRWWSVPGRSCFSVLALSQLVMAHFLWWWNFLPARW